VLSWNHFCDNVRTIFNTIFSCRFYLNLCQAVCLLLSLFCNKWTFNLQSVKWIFFRHFCLHLFLNSFYFFPFSCRQLEQQELVEWEREEISWKRKCLKIRVGGVSLCNIQDKIRACTLLSCREFIVSFHRRRFFSLLIYIGREGIFLGRPKLIFNPSTFAPRHSHELIRLHTWREDFLTFLSLYKRLDR
jgi:hypothetical protein